MINTFFKTGLRNIIRSKTYSLINIFGLSIALACGLFILSFLDFQFSMDSFHHNYKNIYLITHLKSEQSHSKEWGTTPLKLGDNFIENLPSCKSLIRISVESANIKFDEISFAEKISFVDTSFFDMFNFPLSSGRILEFKNGNGVIISNNLSEKLFGKNSPIGKEIVLCFSEVTKTVVISGVAKSFPENSSFNFDVLFSIERMNEIYEHQLDWNYFVNATFIKLNKNKDENKALKYLNGAFLTQYNAISKDNRIKEFRLEPLQTLSLNSYRILSDISGGFGDVTGRSILILIGILIILLACLNYINIALVSASRRFKEIGIRKVLGSKKTSLILQFITENYIINILAFVVGLLIAIQFLIPKFNTMFNVGIRIESVSIYNFLLILIFMPLVTAVLSGLYPSIQISSYNPASMIGGKNKLHNKNSIIKGLLVLQFILSFVTIGFSIVFMNNSNYLNNKDWGYNKKNIFYIKSTDSSQLKIFKDKIEKEVFVNQVALTKNHIGISYQPNKINSGEEIHNSVLFEVCENYLNTLEVESKNDKKIDNTLTLNSKEVLINEKFARIFKLEKPIGEIISLQGENYLIKGVLKNFHYLDFNYAIQPVVIKTIDEKEAAYVIIKTKNNNSVSINRLKETWKTINPNSQIKLCQQEDVFERYFKFIDGQNVLIKFVALISILLSCIGLFGLISFQITNNIKDYCIRKIMGANLFEIMGLIFKKYALVLIPAFGIGIPCFYYAIKFVMENFYRYYKPISFYPFLITGLIIIGIFGISIYSGIFKLKRIDPVKILREE